MPVTSSLLTPAILAQLTSRGVIGSYASNLASGVAQGIEGFVQTLVVQSNDTGTLGIGTGTGKWILEPVSGSSLLTAELASVGITGNLSGPIAQGVAFGISTVVNASAVVQTTVPGVAVGTGLGRVVNATPSVCAGLLYASLVSNGLVGTKTRDLSTALGRGIATWFGTGQITTVVAGTPTAPPAAGVGVGTGSIV